MDILKQALESITAYGGKPYYVGGYVRDHILAVPSKDKDIEVFNLSLDTLQKILEAFGTVDLVGRQFGVLKVHELPNVDFSVPRRDNKIGTSHKDFKVEVWIDATLAQAATRRDLTMNSMFMDCNTLEIQDPFGGQADMKANCLRATDPKKFIEDDLRAVRVAQFISRFPHMVPNDELIELCSKADLSHLPGDRIWEEFRKMLLKGSRPDLGLEFLKTAKLLRFFPELQALVGCQQHVVYHAEGDVFIHTIMALKVATTLRSS